MIIDIAVLLIFLICIILGAKKGFVHSIIGFLSYIISIIICMYLYTPFKNFLYSNPYFYEIIIDFQNNIASSINKYTFQEEGILPAVFSSALNSITGTVSEGLSEIAVSVIIAVIFMILIIISVKLIGKVLKLAVKLPVLKQFNSLLGAAIGGINGIIVCYIAAAVIMFFIVSEGNSLIAEQLNSSVIGAYFFKNNILINLLVGLG